MTPLSPKSFRAWCGYYARCCIVGDLYRSVEVALEERATVNHHLVVQVIDMQVTCIAELEIRDCKRHEQ